MSLRTDYSFSAPAIAQDKAGGDLEDLAYSLDRMPISWRKLDTTGNPDNYRTVRRIVLEFACAAYALQDEAAFSASVGALLEYRFSRTRRYTATAAELLAEIALALAAGEFTIATNAATLVLQQDTVDEGDMPLHRAAHVLARLMTADFPGARAIAMAIAEDCKAKRYPKATSQYFAAWADCAVGISSLNQPMVLDTLHTLDQLHHGEVDKELKRAGANKPAVVTSAFFWDWLMTSLVALATGYRLLPDEGTFPVRYADHAWIAAALRPRQGNDPAGAAEEVQFYSPGM